MHAWPSFAQSVLLPVLHFHLSCEIRSVVCHKGAIDNTRAALHFATCAKEVQMRPQVNRVLDSKAQLKKLMQETEYLKKQLVLLVLPLS